MFAFAVGAVLLSIFGLGMIAAGVFLPDPARGYPPGVPNRTPHEVSWHHHIHGVVGGPVAFIAIFGTCLTLAGRLDGAWRLHTMLTAVVGLALTIWTALAYQKDAVNTGLVQRALILVVLELDCAAGYPPSPASAPTLTQADRLKGGGSSCRSCAN